MSLPMASTRPLSLLSFIYKKHNDAIFRRAFRSSAISLNSGEGLDFEQAAPLAQNRKKMDDYFINPTVQNILMKITGLDYEKVFAPRKEKLFIPKYAFVTEKKLKELQAEATEKALKKLQMPPVMEIRQPINDVMAYNPELQGFTDSKVVFIDTSPNVSDRERFITVREPDGILRKANWDERLKMNQIFFPIPGRNLYTPMVFESPYLEKLLDEESYVYVLDRACAQFEPDDPVFHRVAYAVYNHVNQNKKFDILRSTRHFGPMAFYLAWENKIERLLIDMIERELISDASDMIKLLCILNPTYQVSEQGDTSDLELIEAFIRTNTSAHKATLQLAVQTYIESQQEKEVDIKSEATS